MLCSIRSTPARTPELVVSIDVHSYRVCNTLYDLTWCRWTDNTSSSNDSTPKRQCTPHNKFMRNEGNLLSFLCLISLVGRMEQNQLCLSFVVRVRYYQVLQYEYNWRTNAEGDCVWEVQYSSTRYLYWSTVLDSNVLVLEYEYNGWIIHNTIIHMYSIKSSTSTCTWYSTWRQKIQFAVQCMSYNQE